MTVDTFQGYEINGYTFYTRAQDKKSINQNSGIRMDAVDDEGNVQTYFGVIEEIWELNYGDPSFQVPVGKIYCRRCNDRQLWDDNCGS